MAQNFYLRNSEAYGWKGLFLIFDEDQVLLIKRVSLKFYT